jgi:hypothetical protein
MPWKKGRDLRAIFWEEFLVLKLTIWERFTGFGTNIHPCPIHILSVSQYLV